MISDKIGFIKGILDENNVEYDLLKIKQIYCQTWSIWRNNNALRITKFGLEWLQKYIKFYRIDFSNQVKLPFTNKLLLLLSRHIECPYYLDEDSIWVSTEKVAVQLILFNGDLEKFCILAEKNHREALTSADNSVL